MRTPRTTPVPGGAEAPSSRAPARGRRAHAGSPAEEHGDVDADTAGKDSEGNPPSEAILRRAGRWSPRPRTVRAKIICLLMVPVVSLFALWAYATVTTAQDVARLRQLQRVDSMIRVPVDNAVTALQAERTASVRYATDPDPERQRDLGTLAQRTDRAVAKLRLGDRNTVADGADLPAGVAGRLESFVTGAEDLRTLRSAVRARRVGWDEAYGQYTRVISTAFAVTGALTSVQDPGPGSEARVLLEFSRAGEALAQEDTVLSGARLAGTLDGERLRLFTGAVATRRALTDASVADLRGAEQASWRALMGGSAYGDVGVVEDRALASRPGVVALAAAPEADWNAAHARVRDAMRTIGAGAGRGAEGRAYPLTRGLRTPAGAAVVFGLAAVAASLVISVRIGRGLVVELVALRNSALEIARRKLPDAMRKLRAGEEIDVRAEAPSGPPSEDETGQVAEALGIVHRAALRAAVERAELASGISGVFVNLARRSQVLVHRQLSLLDSMERRSEDPDELGDLFRLDHLTTRMRRHAENLIILSGAAPGRAWRLPVSLTNVVRAAVSEVEDYARVEVRQFPETSVLGAAVADLTHLLAELVENAAQFSPPHTHVRITGEPVGNGYVLEVEDRGLGMGKETLDEANRRIEETETLDLSDSDRLGLFVVSRLAARHDIKVHLRTSPYGGTTAVVLLPTALLQSGPAERSPRQADTEGPAEREYARVSAAPEKEAVRTPVERPVLVAPVQAAVEAAVDTSAETPPPGVTTLRLQRPPEAPDGDDGLPKRVRQASLAPQLREQRAEEPAYTPGPRREDTRTPELVRDRMTAYRAGWARGSGRASGPGGTSAPDAGGDSGEGDPA
ncbi:nitrate- and nitrite sensing domain-containing protein [Streptomyces sp. NPDC059466]|uniref:sensor histidine kinase n=1 Tax=unclassified Streptomyces TaxID=2593676 RepID=UPI00368A0E92